jgi:hypothetical protein
MKQGRLRVLAITAIVASWLFTVDWLVAPLWQGGYRWLDQGVSEMGGPNAKLPWLVNAGIAAMGVALLACAAAVWAVERGRWGAVISVPLAVAGVAGVVSAFATVDCWASVDRACFDRSVAGDASWHAYAHNWAYVVGGGAIGLSALAVAAFWSRRRPAFAVLPAIGGLLGVAWVVLALTGKPKFDPGIHYGLYQRIGLLLGAGWVQLLAAAVLMRLEEGKRTSSAWASAAPQTWSAGRPTRPSA